MTSVRSEEGSTLDCLPIDLLVEVLSYLFAGPIMKHELHKDYKENIFPFLVACPKYWIILMCETRFRFWFSMMTSCYHRDNFMRKTYIIPPRSSVDERKKLVYRLRGIGVNDGLRKQRNRRAAQLYKYRSEIGPVLRSDSYYRGLNHLRKKQVTPNTSTRFHGCVQKTTKTKPLNSTIESNQIDSASVYDVQQRFYYHLVLRCRWMRTELTVADIEEEFDKYEKSTCS